LFGAEPFKPGKRPDGSFEGGDTGRRKTQLPVVLVFIQLGSHKNRKTLPFSPRPNKMGVLYGF